MKEYFKNFMLLALFTGLFLWPAVCSCSTHSDSLGRKIVLKEPPSRIVSLAPSLTEILYYLGLGDRVVGVTQFSYYPPEAASKPQIGSYDDLNVEKIISLDPDLILGTKDGNKPQVIELLDHAGIPAYIVNPRNIREVITTVTDVGRICGVTEKAEKAAAELNRRVDRIQDNVKSLDTPLVFLQINVQPIMTVNRNTFHHDLIHLAGGKNIAADNSLTYPRISIEEVLRVKPEIILISSMERRGMFEQARQGWLQWNFIPAVINHRVHLIDSDLIDRPSPRIIDGLEKMARLIHPEVNWEIPE
ncbi:MAG: cobalamin-binding protein [Deltaproteobacteria bacterium]|nr:cobalamin-binding protein [Deltaproteobacteria bacterium]MBW1914876.1 cobalamin-binding protein [Deltaproteobacteria bacterium]